jgi:hypothetical protein
VKVQAAVAAIACSTAIGFGAGQIAAPQDPARSSTRDRVVIGCVGRLERGEGVPATTYTITDMRATPPSKYRLDGDADQLRLHVGHTVEVAGSITSASSAGDGAVASVSLPALKVRSLTYISTTCAK